MADYLSKYTGQQIDSILDAVDGKLNKTDVVNDIGVDDAQSPASSHLVFTLNSTVTDMETTLTTKVVRTDGGEQTINGRKTFAALMAANGGITVPAGRTITITDEPAVNTDAVNLSMLKKHGLSTDTVTNGSGLKIQLLTNGYNRLDVDLSNLLLRTDATLPQSMAVYTPTGGSQIWAMTSLFNSIFADNRFNGYVKVFDYTADMLDVQNKFNTVNAQLANKVETSVYNTKMGSLDTQISNLQSNKVDTSTYTTKMTSLDTSIANLQANKVDTSTYNAKMTLLDSAIAAKVDTTVYNAKMTSLDTSIANLQSGKVDTTTYALDMANVVKLVKTNTTSVSVPASGSAALPDFNMANLCQVLVTAKWGTLVDTFQVTITYDGTVQTTSLTQKSTAGTLTFAGSVVSGKLRLTATNANTTTAAVVDFCLRASF